MGRTPNYRRDRQKLRSWKALESRVKRNENIMVSYGRGKYPECLKKRPYEWCPQKEPESKENVPKECKSCPQYTNSKFHIERCHEERLKRLRESGIPTAVETPVRSGE